MEEYNDSEYVISVSARVTETRILIQNKDPFLSVTAGTAQEVLLWITLVLLDTPGNCSSLGVS